MYDPDKAMQLYVEDDEGCLPETEEEARKQAEADALNPKKEQATGGGRNWKRKPPPSMTEPQELPLDDKLDSDKIGSMKFGEAPASSGAAPELVRPVPPASTQPTAKSWMARVKPAAGPALGLVVGAGLGYWFRGHRDKTAQGGF